MEESFDFDTPDTTHLQVVSEIQPDGSRMNVMIKSADVLASFFQESYLHMVASKASAGVAQFLASLTEPGRLQLKMEFCERGSLAELLKTKIQNGEAPFDEQTLLDMFKSMIKTVGEVHREHIVLKNISCVNWMIKKDFSLKLASFESARLVPMGKSIDAFSIPNPEETVPQFLFTPSNEYNRYTADFWALGKVFLETLSMRCFPRLVQLNSAELAILVDRKCTEMRYSIMVKCLVQKMLTEDNLNAEVLLEFLDVEKTIKQKMTRIDVRDLSGSDPTELPPIHRNLTSSSSTIVPQPPINRSVTVSLMKEVCARKSLPCVRCENVVEPSKQSLQCDHTLCPQCIHGVLLSKRKLQCPTCNCITTLQDVAKIGSLDEKVKAYLINLLSKYA